jgi:hypothetical protein
MTHTKPPSERSESKKEPLPQRERSWLDYGSFFVVAMGIGAVFIGFISVLFFVNRFPNQLQALAFLTALFGAIVGLVGTYFSVRANRAATSEIESAAEAADAAARQLARTEPQNVLEVAAAQTDLLGSYYRTVLAQARVSFRWAQVLTVIGVLFFLGALTFLMIRQVQPVAWVSAISGALVEVMASVVLVLYGRTTKQLAAFHLRLEQTQRFLLANSICEFLDGETRQETRSWLVRTIADPNSTVRR